MRVLLTTCAERTNFLGMVPLAWALQNAGHEVRVAGQPELTATIAQTGLTCVPVGKDSDFWRVLRAFPVFDPLNDEVPPFHLAQGPDSEITWEALREGFDKVVPWWYRLLNEPMIDDLTAFCRSWRPDLVVWEAVTYAGPIAAQACGAAHARYMWSVDVFGLLRERFVALGREREEPERCDALADWLGARTARAGTAFTEETAMGQFTIDCIPESLRLDVGLDYQPVRYVPYGGRSVVPGWLRRPPERARVALTLGTSATDRTGGYVVGVQEVLDALADLDVEIVAAVPQAEQARTRVPGNTRLVGFVPLDALAATCSVAVNHGGPGTVLTFATHGVPQLVLPHLFDEPVLARTLQAAGAGVAIPGRHATGAMVRDAVVRLLADNATARAAASLRSEIHAMPTPHDAVASLEERVAGLRTAAP